MIPVQLTIEGIYSYQQRQTIDFTTLTEAGLFGIFGPTGSGKSSILEAISYALYGDTERLNKQDKRNYNMMNLKSDKAYIAFDFYNHHNRLYRVTREFKRNSKKFEEVRSPKVVFYQKEGKEWMPLDHTDAEKIIGLSYTNFKRTIIIPQGTFKDFLELGAAKRTEMMQEIFHLHKYDLQDKVSNLNRKNQSALDQTNGQLQAFESISKGEIESLESTLLQLEKAFLKKEKEHQFIEEKFQRLKHLKEDFNQWQEKKVQFQTLKEKESTMLTKAKEVEQYERTYQLFYQPLVALKAGQKSKREKSSRAEKIQEHLTALKKELQGKEETLEKIRPYYKQLSQKRIEEEDLKFIAKISAALKEVKTCKENRVKGERLVSEEKEKQDGLLKKTKEIAQEQAVLKLQRPNTKKLRDAGEWFQQNRNLTQQEAQQSQQIRNKKEELQKLWSVFKEKELDPETFEKEKAEEERQLNEQHELLNKKKEELRVRKKLSEHAYNLEEGEACPLCGSLEHPNIAVTNDESEKLKTITDEIHQIKQQKEALLSKEKIFIAQTTTLEKLKKDLQNEENRRTEMNAEKAQHLTLFTWKELDPKDEQTFKNKQKIADQIEEELLKKERVLDNVRNQEHQQRKKLEQYQQRLNQLTQEENTIQAQINSDRANIKKLNFEEYKDREIHEIQSVLKGLHDKNETVEQEYQLLSETIHQLTPKIASETATLKNVQEQIAEQEEHIKQIRQQLEEGLQQEGIESMEAVRAILLKKIEVTKERKRIEQFKIEFEKVKSSITALEKRLQEVSFSEKLYQEEEEKWKTSKAEWKALNDKVVTLREVVKKSNSDLQQKQELQKQQEKQQQRAENLHTMFKLFKAKGFVQYVSGLHLSQLCTQANVRFQRMTRNQLSLQLNEDNDFEIIDYLNEGKSRSVKTLSGGQAFQVSLSLALALAENIQTHAKAEKKFFFIDEGFGTQDSEAINIIFETLLHLNKSNKIVGIISHVEALKDRIPQALIIENDVEKGSLIKEY